MARVKLTEYRAKKILLGNEYQGISIGPTTAVNLPAKGEWVVKVDQGVKKRFTQGLVALNIAGSDIEKRITEWKEKGFSQFLLEPFLAHASEEERYISFERVREGIKVLYAREGGVAIEAHPESVETYMICSKDDISEIAQKTNIPIVFLEHLYEIFIQSFFSFIEINPFIVRNEEVLILDAAVLVDDAGTLPAHGTWSTDDVVQPKIRYAAEESVEKIAATTSASLKLTVLNPDGALFLLLSGGGGSIVIADEAKNAGVESLLGNYGEYSGSPTREETYLYSKEIIQLLLNSKAQKKALVIAGGVANFTDVEQTFTGIIDALSEVAETLRAARVRVFVRRGGPNEVAGLERMRQFLEKEELLGTLYGSETVITQAVDDAIHFIKS